MENIFKSQLSALRQKKHLSQELLAQKLFVSRQSISKWENGESEPNIDKLISISEIFSVNLDFLLAGHTHGDALILELKNLNKSFKNPVLKDVNLSIYGRDRIALLGSNGSGKTTIVNTILGNIIPDKGNVVKHFNAQYDLSVMTQENCLIGSLKVREQIALSLKIYDAYSTANIDAMLKKFRLTEQSEVIVDQLSGGQKRRLALLLTLIKPSKLLILDEPTVGMDLESIDLFWDYLDHVGGSVVTITHDFNQIDNYFTRVVLLKDGVIKSDESVANIHSNNQTIEHWYRLMNQ
ncbi:XRE family transcriptional regulator [Leuconostoc falkenbergense]|uniref:XRE family transcriptional regulator n=3 Tax=Leuconostoc falkenbergense TaxID=2766470 RepID=UPI0021AA80C7|nr:XRE family transcriptional regulator [Leuconostoc falkenbergense]MCT4377787.1 XRE family transcriptional regulator [Leuconostoc falkenbergense]MDV8951812.1 ATP-binding cassette domain-containing protein [Leuconostoc falkenbergense]